MNPQELYRETGTNVPLSIPEIRWSGTIRPPGSRPFSPPPERSVYLAADDAQLYTVRHPVAGHLRGRIMLAGPFPSQRLYANVAWTSWARLLAANGYEVLRFDYRGTGESTGHFEECTFERWYRDLLICIDSLQQDDGIPLLVHGLLMGGLLASRCFSEKRVDGLLSWEPVTSARKMLKEMLRGKLSEDMVLATDGERKNRQAYIDELLGGRIVEVDGFPWTKTLWESSSEMELTTPDLASTKPWLKIRLIRNKRQRSVGQRPEWKIPIVYPPFWADNQYMVPDLLDLFQQSLCGVHQLIERTKQ